MSWKNETLTKLNELLQVTLILVLVLSIVHVVCTIVICDVDIVLDIVSVTCRKHAHVAYITIFMLYRT